MYFRANLNEGPLSFDQFNAFFSLREKKKRKTIFRRPRNENNSNNKTKQKKLLPKLCTVKRESKMLEKFQLFCEQDCI